MAIQILLLALIATSCTAFPLHIRDGDPKVASIVAAAKIPKYTPPTTASRDITDWLAIGDSFSAGISADTPSDELNWSCSRFKKSYPNQMNENPRFPGHSSSRTFVFGACTGGKMQDVIDTQIELGDPDLKATNPKIGKPQVGTLSISGNDLGFGDIVNSCLYHWTGSKDCTQMLKDAHSKLDDPGHAFEYDLVGVLAKIMARARTANPTFQLYVTGYIPFWDDTNDQCNDVSWAPWYKAKAPLTRALRSDMNGLVLKLNDQIKKTIEAIGPSFEGGVFYVDGFQDKFKGHRFCEQEADPAYHQKPIADRTWFIHYESAYEDAATAAKFGPGTFFDHVNNVLIPPRDGKSTEDQIKAVNGDLAKLNPAYNDVDSMTKALTKLAQDDHTYSIWPTTWIRVMHPKGSGYTTMSDAVIDAVINFRLAGGDSGTAPGPTSGDGGDRKCAGLTNTKFLGRDDLNDKIGTFCRDAAAQKVQDKDSASTVRTYNSDTRWQVTLSMDWPSGLDITQNMESNCKKAMTSIMDDCDGDGTKNPLNWKHGGTKQVDKILYHVIPTQDQGYTPGICTFHLQEDEAWTGIDGPGTDRKHFYGIEQALMKDGANKEISRLGFKKDSGDGDQQWEGDGNPLSWKTPLPDALVITSESQGDPADYIQFTIGKQSWKTSDPQDGPAGCTVGAWSGQWSPINRNMDCHMGC